MAIRMGQARKRPLALFITFSRYVLTVCDAVGLHVRIPDGKIANDDRIERNWVYWNVFIHVSSRHLYLVNFPALTRAIG